MIRQLITFVFCGLGLLGCTDEVFEERRAAVGEGRLILSDLRVTSIEGEVRTKASLDEALIPAASDFSLTVVDATSGDPVKTLEAGVKECLLPPGEYKLTASYGEEKAISKSPYFYGESEAVTIADGATASVELTVSLGCAVILPEVAESLAAQYDYYTLTLSVTKKDASPAVSEMLTSGEDFFVQGGEGNVYNLSFSGQNKLGKTVTHTWNYSDLVKRVRYIVKCDPDLPAFTLPAQAETNAWSEFIYITPLTAENISYKPEGMTDEEILSNLAYEVSADGEVWTKADPVGDRFVAKALKPATAYTIRARFGGVNSGNTEQLTTENAEPLRNGDMESWSKDKYSTYGVGSEDIYRYYVGASASDRYWATRNTLTMEGVEGGTSSGTSNQVTGYRWNSCTIPTSDAVSGQAAEIRTMALATIPIKGTEVGSGWFWANNDVASVVKNNHRVYNGFLYTGSADVTSSNENPDEYGLAHGDRPVSVSFSYKYAPYGTGEHCVVYAKVFDAEKREIASASFQSAEAKNTYEEVKLSLTYSDPAAKAAYLFILFRSGEKESWNYVQYKSGSYGANPWSLDTFVGSVLKIDNVQLNYAYEQE